MGYYTNYSLSVIDNNDDLVQEFRSENENADHALSGDSCKWYSHEEELKEFSKKHPEVLFKLYGEGEESGDIWAKYVKNGKVQTCKARIAFDDYDPSKLK